jgi:hypothetical protein
MPQNLNKQSRDHATKEPTMRIIDNWWLVLTRGWTAWVGYIGALVNGASVAVYLFTATLPVPSIWLIVLNGLLAFAVPLLRVIQQKSVSGGDA